MQHYIDVVQDRSGNVIGGAIVVITDNSTGLPVTVYSDAGGSIVQPTVTTDVNGTFSFYVGQGRYNFVVTKNGVTLKTVNDVDIPGDYPTAMTLADAQAGTNPTTQTISASILNAASQYGAFTPTGTISATSIKNALGELDTEKASLANLSASTGSTLVGTTNGGTGAVTRTVASKLNETVSVKDFGAVGDQAHDDTAAFNLAIASGKSIYVPTGFYRITSALNPLTSGQIIHGDGPYTSSLLIVGSGYDAITLEGNFSGVSGIGFFAPGGTPRTSGSYITVTSSNILASTNNVITNFYLENSATGIHITGPNTVNTFVNNGYILGATVATGIGILIDGGANAEITNVLIDGGGSTAYPMPPQALAAISIPNHGGAFLTSVSTARMGTGLLIAPTTGQGSGLHSIVNCDFDSSNDYGILIAPTGTGRASGSSFSNVWVGNAAIGICINAASTANVAGLQFGLTRIYNSYKQGLYLQNMGTGGPFAFSDSSITGSSLIFAGYAHVEIAANIGKFNFNNNVIGNIAPFSSTALCGVLIGSGDASFVVADNYFVSPLTGIIDNSTATDKVIRDNYGSTVVYDNAKFTSISCYGAGAIATNFAAGSGALVSNTTGSTSTAVGVSALLRNTIGISNNAVGYSCLSNNVSGGNNNAVGINNLIYNTIGSGHAAFGHNALLNNTTAVATLGAITGGSGYTNGSYTGVSLTYVSGSTAIAYPTANITVAGGIVTACTLVTNGIGFKDTTTVMSCASIGAGTGFAISPATLVTAQQNLGVGNRAGGNITTGSNNVVIGGYLGDTAPISATGSNYVVLSDGAGNVREYFDASGHAVFNATTRTAGYTVATLPTGTSGMRAYVTNALTPVWGSTVVTGGAVTVPVFYNGANWIVG